jgi:predicted dehydrogenase
MPLTRRELIRSTAVVAAASVASSLAKGAAPVAQSQPTTLAATTRANSRPGIAVIGCGGITRHHAKYLDKYGDLVALCDVDKNRLDAYNKDFAKGKAFGHAHYPEILARKDVDIVVCGTPDHWHSKITTDAMRAGKDVYCEKPLTLTIAEGRILERVARETNRVLQVGTQQRSEEPFLIAVALVHAGRLGKIRHVTVAVGDTPKGADFKTSPPPAEIDWDLWLGQAPKTDYIKQRCHYDFRWWYEYSGGRMTDWGAHHVDIAQWAVAPDLPGPTTVEPLHVDFTVPFEHGYPTVSNAFNTSPHFEIKCSYANGVELFIKDRAPGFTSDNGILFVGDGGWLFINREKVMGPAYDALKEDPLPDGAVRATATSLPIPHERHFINFIDCVRTRALPASDVWSHHRSMTTLHLANIASRVGRKIRWDANAQEIVGDAEADAFQSRAQRRGYEVV